MKSIEYYLGVLCGFMSVCIVGFLIYYIKTGMTKKYNKQYDERQMLARGQAYHIGYFVLLFYILFLSIADSLFPKANIYNPVWIFLGICLSLGVFGFVCIIKDAYVSLVETPKKVIIFLVQVGLLNVFIGLMECESHDVSIIENGKPQIYMVNFMCGILMFFLAIVLIVKQIYENKHTSNEE